MKLARRRDRSALGASTLNAAGKRIGSKAERARAKELQLLDERGIIRLVGFQVTFTLFIDPKTNLAFVRCMRLNVDVDRPGVRVEGYRADAVYYDRTAGALVVEDTKHKLITRDFERKKAWMTALGFPVRIYDASRGGIL